MRLSAAFAVFCLAVMAALPAQAACRIRPVPPSNPPHADLYRDLDRALVIATILNRGASLDARLQVDEVVYGAVADTPLMLGWSGDPQYSYRYVTSVENPDGSITVGGCSYEPELPVVEQGQRVLAKIGVTRTGEQVVVRWDPLQTAADCNPRFAAYLAQRDTGNRQRLGEALRPYDTIGITLVCVVPVSVTSHSAR